MLALIMVFTFAACNGTDDPDEPVVTDPADPGVTDPADDPDPEPDPDPILILTRTYRQLNKVKS